MRIFFLLPAPHDALVLFKAPPTDAVTALPPAAVRAALLDASAVTRGAWPAPPAGGGDVWGAAAVGRPTRSRETRSRAMAPPAMAKSGARKLAVRISAGFS